MLFEIVKSMVLYLLYKICANRTRWWNWDMLLKWCLCIYLHTVIMRLWCFNVFIYDCLIIFVSIYIHYIEFNHILWFWYFLLTVINVFITIYITLFTYEDWCTYFYAIWLKNFEETIFGGDIDNELYCTN